MNPVVIINDFAAFSDAINRYERDMPGIDSDDMPWIVNRKWTPPSTSGAPANVGVR